MCTIEECEKQAHSKGLCQNHYRQSLRAARGLKKPGPKPDPTKWRSRHNSDNPNRAKEPKEVSAKEMCKHGHSYSVDGYVRDDGSKVCRACQRIRTERYRDKTNPDRKKWEPAETRQAKRLAAIELKKYLETHCRRGHEFTEDNTYHYSTYRQCKTCIKLNGLQNSYGIDATRVSAMLDEQSNSCAICEEEFTQTPRVDHDHITGIVRGLLCHHCNTGLGQFKDNVESLKSAIKYLEKFSNTTTAE